MLSVRGDYVLSGVTARKGKYSVNGILPLSCADPYSLTENINTTTPSGKLTFHIFAALAEFERDILRQRVNAGLKAARRRGRLGGRPKSLTEARWRYSQGKADGHEWR